MTIFAWVLFGYALLYGVRYLLGARVYLTCALREVAVEPISREQLDPAELRLLTSLDDELAAAGFRHLGFGQIAPFLTYYAQGLPVSVFVNERLPAYALVRQHAAPEYGNLVEVEVWTAFGAPGYSSCYSQHAVLAPLHASKLACRGLPGDVRGRARGAACRPGGRGARAPSRMRRSSIRPSKASWTSSRPASPSCARSFASVNGLAPTTNHTLDRFTLRGAFALTHYSRRVFGARRKAPQQPPAPTETERLLRIEADLRAICTCGRQSRVGPGHPLAALTVIGMSGLLSFIAMAWLWNPYVAALILAAITLHEAGHAVAMRMLGYRDVHVFFVPLLGAMTVGRSVTTTVRDRLAVLLAGPVPGLWLAVVLLAIDAVYMPVDTIADVGVGSADSEWLEPAAPDAARRRAGVGMSDAARERLEARRSRGECCRFARRCDLLA